jgi:hypothetical protein
LPVAGAASNGGSNWWKTSSAVAVGVVLGFILLTAICVGVCSQASKQLEQVVTTPASVVQSPASVANSPLSDLGKTRFNPIPLGSGLQYGDIELTVLGFKRESNIGWLCSASGGKTYAVATIRLRNLGSPNSTESFFTYDFRMVGLKATIYDNEYCSTGGNFLESGELFGGGMASGDVVCKVDSDDTHLLLIWSADWGESRYFALE